MNDTAGCPIPLDALSGAAKKAADPSSPVPARMMAARGMAPMAPRELVTVQYMLTFDPDEKVRDSATASLANLDARIANAALPDTGLNPFVLAYLAVALAPRDADVERILLNPSTPSAAFVDVAKIASEAVCEIIANNQARLLQEPEIARSLITNANVPKSTKDRVIDFLVRNSIVLDGVGEFEQALLRLNKDERLKAADAVNIPLEFLDHSLLTPEQKAELESRRLIADEGDEVEEEEEKKGLEQKIRDMSTGDKIAFATKGNKEVRTRLMRDPNRIVALASISSPSVTEIEVGEAARSRVVHQDVIGYICNQKDWVKQYPIKVALANNPKCPLPQAMKFVTLLRKKDLKALSVSKNVPAAVRIQALKLVKNSRI